MIMAYIFAGTYPIKTCLQIERDIMVLEFMPDQKNPFQSIIFSPLRSLSPLSGKQSEAIDG